MENLLVFPLQRAFARQSTAFSTFSDTGALHFGDRQVWLTTASEQWGILTLVTQQVMGMQI